MWAAVPREQSERKRSVFAQERLRLESPERARMVAPVPQIASREQEHSTAAGELADLARAPTRRKATSCPAKVRGAGTGSISKISTMQLHLLAKLWRGRRGRSRCRRRRIRRRRRRRRGVRRCRRIRSAGASLLRLPTLATTAAARSRLLTELLHALPLFRADHHHVLRDENIIFDGAARKNVVAGLNVGHRDGLAALAHRRFFVQLQGLRYVVGAQHRQFRRIDGFDLTGDIVFAERSLLLHSAAAGTARSAAETTPSTGAALPIQRS